MSKLWKSLCSARENGMSAGERGLGRLTLGNQSTGADLNGATLIVVALLVHTAGPQTVMILPGFIQGLVEYGGFSETEAGFVASSELLGMTMGAIAMMFLAARLSWRFILIISLLSIFLGNLATIGVQELNALRFIRFIVGIGGGAVVSISFTIFGLTKKADRNFALGILFVLVYAAVVYPFLPIIFSTFGLNGILIFMAGFGALCLPFVRLLPNSGKEHLMIDDQASDVGLGFRAMALSSMLIFFSANFAVWTYFFRIGISAGVLEQSVANSLSLSQFLGMAGAFACALVGAKYGRAKMLTIAILGCGLPLVFLIGPFGALGYTIIVCVYQFAWNMAHPYILAAMASFDPTGRMVVYAAAMQFIGVSLGPAIAALYVNVVGYNVIIAYSIFALTVSWVLILMPVLRERQLSAAA